MSRFTDTMIRNACESTRGMVTGEPHTPVRHTWREVHERARRVAGGLAAAGIGHDDTIGVLVEAPVEIAPIAQGLWIRGAAVSMLHQPPPRTDLMEWADHTSAAIETIKCSTVIVSERFFATVSMLEERGVKVLLVDHLLASDPADPSDIDEDDLALIQLTSGSTGRPKAVLITHRNLYSNIAAMFAAAGFGADVDNEVMVSWLPCAHDMGMIGFLTLPMCFGLELVKVTPMDFLRDALLWATLIDKYQATMTGAPNRFYALFARRLREQAKPGQFDLSTLRFALSGSEPVEPGDIEDLIDAGAPFGLKPQAILAAYGMAEATLAVSFSEYGVGLVVDEVDADLLSASRRAVPTTAGNVRRLAALGPPLQGLEVRVVDENGTVLPTRDVGVIELRGESLTPGYVTTKGFVRARNEQGWYDTGDLGYRMENGHIVVCDRVADVITTTSGAVYPTAIERAAGRVAGVRSGCAVAVRLNAGHLWESFAVAVESNVFEDRNQAHRIERQVADEVLSEVHVRPRDVVVLGPGTIPKTPSGKLQRTASAALIRNDHRQAPVSVLENR
ncbi:fatty acyl-AMP ligase [Mycobacterium spongiae]|uniref:AMP-binding protein n=1 Tax=Mycobacterium spongiae TaxID=886343 RepID=A0A975K2U6_9MYCO|nr:fatty acyl-AMP ligase [Mycobacterium spongiae]QUR69740.1 AMP-binding protein [Mycobacterium spongiae]